MFRLTTTTNECKYATFSVSTDDNPSATTCRKNITLEIDNSDSMKQQCGEGLTRLGKVLETVVQIVKYLFRPEYADSNIWIAVNSYNDNHRQHICPTQITGLSPEEQERVLAEFVGLSQIIRPDSMTNIENPVKAFVETVGSTADMSLEREACLQTISEIKAALFQSLLSPDELVGLSQTLTATSLRLQSLPVVENYLVLLTDGQITRGMVETQIVETYLREMPLQNVNQLYFIGFGKEHSAGGLNTLDRGIGNYFGVLSGSEGTAIAVAEIIFRIAKPGLRNIALSIRHGNGLIFDAPKGIWAPEISMGMFTPGRTFEFYVRIPLDEDESLIEYKHGNGHQVSLVPLEGGPANDPVFSELRLETLKLMSEINTQNRMFSSIDYLSKSKTAVFSALLSRVRLCSRD